MLIRIISKRPVSRPVGYYTSVRMGHNSLRPTFRTLKELRSDPNLLGATTDLDILNGLSAERAIPMPRETPITEMPSWMFNLYRTTTTHLKEMDDHIQQSRTRRAGVARDIE